MAKQSFESRRLTLGELITGANIYEVPSHQRDYSWEKEEIEEFWRDLIGAIKEENYFFGSMIFQDSINEKIKIILDGQQRLATVTILLSAIRDLLYELKDYDYAQEIQSHFIIDKYLKKEVRKLTLNVRNNDFFYYCIQKFPTDKDNKE